jgi:hypothetical protein
MSAAPRTVALRPRDGDGDRTRERGFPLRDRRPGAAWDTEPTEGVQTSTWEAILALDHAEQESRSGVLVRRLDEPSRRRAPIDSVG